MQASSSALGANAKPNSIQVDTFHDSDMSAALLIFIRCNTFTK